MLTGFGLLAFLFISLVTIILQSLFVNERVEGLLNEDAIKLVKLRTAGLKSQQAHGQTAQIKHQGNRWMQYLC